MPFAFRSFDAPSAIVLATAAVLDTGTRLHLRRIEAARAAVADRAHMPRAHDGQVAALARHLRHGRFWMWEERARDKRISCHPTLADSFS